MPRNKVCRLPIARLVRMLRDRPLMPRVMAIDETTAELQHLLSGQPRGLLYMRDELAGWLGNLDRYGGHGADRAFLHRGLERRSPMSRIGLSIAVSRCGSSAPPSRFWAACSPTGCAKR